MTKDKDELEKKVLGDEFWVLSYGWKNTFGMDD
jgi:hypothetical protein